MTYPENIPSEPKSAHDAAKPMLTTCLCPGDCNCRHQDAPWHRFNYCGCKAHTLEEWPKWRGL